MLKEASKQYSQKGKLILLILTGTISWSWTMVKSGWFYSSLGKSGPGLGFWGANGHDGIVHIALAESLSRGSFAIPFFAGSAIQNYHIGFDLILAFLHEITFIPTVNLYFQILPPVFALLVGLLTYKFVLEWSGSEKAATWSVFFTYFGGSFGWVLEKGESAFWSQQSISTLINPPFALSLILLLLGLILLQKLERQVSPLNLVFCILIFGILIEIKAYAGVLTLGALLISGLYSLAFYKNSLLLKVFTGSLLLSLILYLPLNHGAASLLVFQPFWFLETLMGMADRLNYTKFYSAMLSYRSGHNYLKAIPAYLVAFVIFWVGNMGTRIVKEFEIFKWIKNVKRLSLVQVFIASVIVAGGLIPILFLQKGTPWNTIQFFYYSLFFSSILAGIVISRVKSKILLVLVLLTTIPTTILTLKDVYIPARPPAMLSSDESTALSFLSKQPEGVVLTKPFDQIAATAAENNPPRPLYLYASTAYVSAFSKHQTFFEDEINLDITGYNWQERRSQILDWYHEKDQRVKRGFLTQNNIKYIYWLRGGDSPLSLQDLGLSNIYENNLVTVYRVE
jgi:hypothetical protein